jgi:hypothetical protein
LRKGCGRRFQARRYNQRYCREPECLEEVRRWQAAKRQRKRRSQPEARQRHAEAERQRRRRRASEARKPSEEETAAVALSQAAIARRLHCHHRTVRKALAVASPPVPTREPHESDLDSYHAQIDALVAKYPDLSAVRVFEEIARGEDGYRGSVYPVRRYLHKIRPSRGRVYQEWSTSRARRCRWIGATADD